jgi:hypothetical protein
MDAMSSLALIRAVVISLGIIGAMLAVTFFLASARYHWLAIEGVLFAVLAIASFFFLGSLHPVLEVKREAMLVSSGASLIDVQLEQVHDLTVISRHVFLKKHCLCRLVLKSPVPPLPAAFYSVFTDSVMDGVRCEGPTIRTFSLLFFFEK